MKRSVAMAVLIGIAGAANALDRIVNIPGQYALCNGCTWAPMGLSFDAGSYTVTPVVADSLPGALYTAYNFGQGLGWSSAYAIALDRDHIMDFGLSGPHLGSGWPDPATAFSHTAPGSFSLPQAATVYFGVPDSIHGDNFGGVSLRIAPVPEPSQVALLVTGLGLLGFGVRRATTRS